MRYSVLVAVILLLAAAVGAQKPIPVHLFKVNGNFVSREGTALAGLVLAVDKKSAGTDDNGRFELDLAPGVHEIVILPENLYRFRATLRIVEAGPNPDNVTFTVDMARVCCTTVSGQPFAKLVSFPKPPYPAAARAVRAHGQVIVNVTVGPDGKVTNAEVLSGHPLLVNAALSAARSAHFEPSESPEREARLFYLFARDDKNPNSDLKRYTSPYTLEVIPIVLALNTAKR